MNSDSKSNKKTGLFVLTLGALGVVYGDIGTSPLYAINEIFFGRGRTLVTNANVLGSISLVLWALICIIAFKYIIFVLRADNDGEGGVFSLFALLGNYKKRSVLLLTSFLILAAGFLLGEGIITPAISVLSAVEGLKVATPAFKPYVIPITVVILTTLFAFQYKGTAKVGAIFGPIIGVWFAAISLLGLKQIVMTPAILAAFNPIYGASFLIHNGIHASFIVLGSVILVVTGGEALYADMGHFGRLPIRISWFTIVFPSLILNYLGQGAYLISGQTVSGNNLFFSLVPLNFLYPMVVLATFATIIASQALISGAYSLISQAIALGLFPRFDVRYTHEHHAGQIYVPFINWSLYIGCILLVFIFRSASALAAAYGLAVSGVMLATTCAMIAISRYTWKWGYLRIVVVWLPLFIIDASFLIANSLKFVDGGFIPFLIGIGVFIVMTTWYWGRQQILDAYSQVSTMTVGRLINIKKSATQFFPRSMLILTPTYVSSAEDKIPAHVQLFWERYKVLPKHLILLTIVEKKTPYIRTDRYRISIFDKDKDRSFIAVEASFGFKEEPDVERVIGDIAANEDLTPYDDLSDWIIFVGKERIVQRPQGRRRNKLRFYLFRLIFRNTERTYSYFGIDDDVRLTTEIIPVAL